MFHSEGNDFVPSECLTVRVDLCTTVLSAVQFLMSMRWMIRSLIDNFSLERCVQERLKLLKQAEPPQIPSQNHEVYCQFHALHCTVEEGDAVFNTVVGRHLGYRIFLMQWKPFRGDLLGRMQGAKGR